MKAIIFTVAAFAFAFSANAALIKYQQAGKVAEITKREQTIGIYEYKTGSTTCFVAMNETGGYTYIPSISCVK